MVRDFCNRWIDWLIRVIWFWEGERIIKYQAYQAVDNEMW